MRRQRHGRYLPSSRRRPGEMLPALARRAIETYSDRGGLVLDPYCGTGTTLSEAIHLDRRAVGLTPHSHEVGPARAAARRARHEGAPGRARVIRGEPYELPRLLAAHARHLLVGRPVGQGKVAHLPFRRVDLILTAPPRCSRELLRLIGACVAVLRPGGFLLLANPAPSAVAVCERAGLAYWQHIIALTVAIRDGRLQHRPLCTRRRHDPEQPIACHLDLLAFRAPEPQNLPAQQRQSAIRAESRAA